MEKARLDKIIAGEGTYSRREVRLLVRQGRVLVDGVPARSPEDKVVPEAVEIMVDGTVLHCRRYTWIMLHKPAGVPLRHGGRPGATVLDLLPPELRRRGLFPVGRLDKDTEGLLLLTNEGGLAHDILLSQASCGQGLLCPHCRLSDEGGLQGVCGRHDPGRRPGMPAGGAGDPLRRAGGQRGAGHPARGEVPSGEADAGGSGKAGPLSEAGPHGQFATRSGPGTGHIPIFDGR